MEITFSLFAARPRGFGMGFTFENGEAWRLFLRRNCSICLPRGAIRSYRSRTITTKSSPLNSSIGACSPCNALRWYRQSGIVLHFFVRDGPGINPRVEPRSQGSTLINHEKTLASELVRFRKTISSWYPGKGVTYNKGSTASVPIN